MRQPTTGPVLKERVWCFVEALLTRAEDSPDFEIHWETDKDTDRPNFVVKTKRRFLERLAQLKQHEIYEVIESLEKLQIWDDRRLKRGKGSEIGLFALKLWSTDAQRNREQFEQIWEDSRPDKSKALEVTFKKSAVSKGATPCAPTEDDWHNICRTMLESQKRLTTNQLMCADEDMKFELDDIHVPLALVQRTKPDKRSGDVSPEEGSRLLQPTYEEKQRYRHEEFLAQVLQEGKGQSKGRRIALIGEPGAGKTTLLQSIAFWILDKNLGLPIWISLADLQGKTVEEYLLHRWLKNALEVVRVTSEQENAFVELFKQERVWLFLDGVDEIAGGSVGANHELPLQMVASQLEGWVAKARVVLSCRLNVWEANINALGDDFETYRLLDFDYPNQVKEFIRRWFRKTDADKGERLWAELDKSERQRIQDLVKNPLRLALLFGLAAESETQEKVYAFFHPTFEEYFAALAIDDWHFFLNHVPHNPAQGNYRIFEPQWKEVILLWLGREEVEREQFIEALVEFEDGCKDFYKDFYGVRAFFLTAAGIAEFRNCSKADKIVAQIVRWGFGYFNTEKQEWRTFLDPIAEGARATLSQTDHGRAIEKLINLLKTTESEDAHCSAAECLGEIDPGNQQAIEALVQILSTTESEDTRYSAAYSLGNIDPGNKQAVEALVRILETTESEDTRWRAAECLGEIGPGNKQAIEALVRILETTESKATRRSAAKSLGKIVQKSQMPSVVSALQHCLADEVYQTNFDLYSECYNLIWRCAENMTYPAFYQAWHPQEEVEKTTTLDSQSLNQADLPQSLQSAITNAPQLMGMGLRHFLAPKGAENLSG